MSKKNISRFLSYKAVRTKLAPYCVVGYSKLENSSDVYSATLLNEAPYFQTNFVEPSAFTTQAVSASSH